MAGGILNADSWRASWGLLNWALHPPTSWNRNDGFNLRWKGHWQRAEAKQEYAMCYSLLFFHFIIHHYNSAKFRVVFFIYFFFHMSSGNIVVPNKAQEAYLTSLAHSNLIHIWWYSRWTAKTRKWKWKHLRLPLQAFACYYANSGAPLMLNSHLKKCLCCDIKY